MSLKSKKRIFKKIVTLALIFAMFISGINFTTTKVSASTTGDPMVLATQKWLNSTYGSDSRYNVIPENGQTGWTTIYALTRALQIELGIQQTADNFGSGSQSAFNTMFPNGVVQQADGATLESNVYGIIQGALWCKGYSVGSTSITKHFYDGTGGALRQLKSDAGFTNPNSTVTLNVMKSLLSMNQFKLVYGGSSTIRGIQQNLNVQYPSYIGMIPCDGIYGRDMNKALIIVLQAIEGYSVANATGNFGSGTKASLPILPDTSNVLPQTKEDAAIKLLKYCLCVNGYDIGTSQYFDTSLKDTLVEFQKNMNINQTGNADIDTWMALFLSTGNPNRSSIACDTRFEMTQERLDYLKNNGYNIVGRYLTGGDYKQLRDEEPQRIIDSGLSFFPIFQESGTDINYFTNDRGTQDAYSAVKAAYGYGISKDNVIYFAVDMDATDTQIQNYILPYFQSIAQTMHYYKIGVYGTRNVCTQVMNSGFAATCFISDLSTGFSGNMGFKMPTNWNLDQFSEISVNTASGSWDLDKVAYSGKFSACNSLDKRVIEITEDTQPEYKFNIPDGAKNMTINFSFKGNSETSPWIVSSELYKMVVDNGAISYEEITTSPINVLNGNENAIGPYNVSSLLDYKLRFFMNSNWDTSDNIGGKIYLKFNFEF